MIRIDAESLEWSPIEICARHYFDERLDHGDTVVQAAALTHNIFGENLSDEFYLYLSDGHWKP